LFQCQVCGVVVTPNTPAHQKVVETRRREYPFRKEANLFIKDSRPKKTDDPGGIGFEIVREVVVCPGCSEEPAALSSEGCGPPVWAVAA
jgi:rubredoxin